jgi:ATP-binding cassette, subfamily C, bacterial
MRYQTVANGESAFWSLQDEIAEAEGDVERNAGRLPPPPLDRGLELDDVSFAYGKRPVLTHASLAIPAGSFVAIVGPSGAGKTTIADLILGLYEPTAGGVRLDGVNLEEVDLRAWRSKVGYVPQETLLFNDTILNNVTLGDPGIPPAEVEWALRAAGGWDFVRDRAGGLNAPIGEAGAAFSGGQRQRISIARALVRHPRLLILDEATTALDPATERAIGETLEHLRGELTIVAISHQPALREAADIVYEVSAGRVRRVAGPTTPAVLAPSAPGLLGNAP